MCGLVLLSEDGEEEGEGSLSGKRQCIGVGVLLSPHDSRDPQIEVAQMEPNGFGGYEIVSDRVVPFDFDSVVTALRELGFTFAESMVRTVFDALLVPNTFLRLRRK